MGPTWTLLWPECGLLDSLLKRNKKTFFSLGVLKLGTKIMNTHISLTTRPSICKLWYSVLMLFKDLGNKTNAIKNWMRAETMLIFV